MPLSQAAHEILNIEKQIIDAKSKLKTIDEDIAEQLDTHEAYKKGQTLKTELVTAKLQLDNVLQGDEAYNNLMTQRADCNDDINALRSTLSSMLVAYFAETKDKEIEVSDTYSREVIVSGRLGKPKRTQLRLA